MSESRSTAVTVVPDVEERLDEQEDEDTRFRRALDRIRELNKDEDPDEVLAFVTKIVEEVRQEHHEREQREAQGRR